MSINVEKIYKVVIEINNQACEDVNIDGDGKLSCIIELPLLLADKLRKDIEFQVMQIIDEEISPDN